jgi:predicted phosphoadenosine phosphosulfate sulfurtransferase
MGVLSQRGVRTLAPDQFGVRHIVPLYDWQVGDVWRAIHENGWDYNRAYDVMQRQGFKAASMRIAPLSMTPAEVPEVQMAARTWPGWFDRVCERLPGMRSVALFGVRVLEPTHHRSESWEQTFRRECVERAPKWIADRCRVSEETILRAHRHHATGGLPDVANCPHCHWGWRRMALELFNGDAFSQHLESLPYVQPDFFRPGSGRWDSRPN